MESNHITREELAAAYLTLFFKGKLTQSALSTAIELSNIKSSIKLPTSFDGLLNIITKKKNLVEYEKTWFCGYCLKLIGRLDNRFQRACSNCNTRYYSSFYLKVVNFFKLNQLIILDSICTIMQISKTS